MQISKKGHRARGFTLIELLVVIAIIGILSSVVLASLNSARLKGRDAKRISDIKQLQLALELAYDASGAYPSTTSVATLVTPGYIAALPTDPQSGLLYSYAALQGTAASAATCASYHLGTTLEGTTNSVLDTDSDNTTGGTYGATANGPVCTGSAADFAGTDPIYDVRP